MPGEQPPAAPTAATPASPQPGFRDLSLLSRALRPADATPAQEGPGEDTAQGPGLGSAGLAGVVSEAAERLRRAQSGLAAAAEARDAVRMGTSASSGAGGEGSAAGFEARAARRLSSGSGSPTSRPASAAGPDAALAGAEHTGEPVQAQGGPLHASLSADRGARRGSHTPSDTSAAPRAADMPAAGAPAAAAGAQGSVAASAGAFRAPSGDVTLATRDAFDTINAMFRGALPQEAPWQALGPAERPAARETQPPAAAVVACSAPEPTVTISTRAAYEALSGMFAGALPHEQARRTRAAAPEGAGGQGIGGVKGLAAAQVPRPGRASSPGVGAPERTLVIYEDTQFGGARPGGSGADSREDSPEPRPHSADAAHAAGMLDVYEDTQFGLAAGAGQGSGISAAAGGARHVAASPPLAVYEDTQFTGAGPAGLGFAAASAHGAPSPGAPQYEPTQFMSENVAPPAAAARPRRALFGKRRQPGASPDAAGPQSPVLHAASVGARADKARAAAAPRPHYGAPTAEGPDGVLEGGCSGGAGPDTWLDDTRDLLEDQENLAPDQGAAGSAGAAARGAAPGVLHDISADAAAAMGIALGGGEDVGSPLRRLRLVRARRTRLARSSACVHSSVCAGTPVLSCSRATWAWSGLQDKRPFVCARQTRLGNLAGGQR